MLAQKAPTDGSCCATAFATVLDEKADSFMSYIRQEEVITDDDGTVLRNGFNMIDCALVAMFNYAPFLVVPISEEGFMDYNPELDMLMKDPRYRLVLGLRNKADPSRTHAVAYHANSIYDPVDGKVKHSAAYLPHWDIVSFAAIEDCVLRNNKRR